MNDNLSYIIKSFNLEHKIKIDNKEYTIISE